MEQLEKKIREALPRLKELTKRCLISIKEHTDFVELCGSVLLLISIVIFEVIIKLQKNNVSIKDQSDELKQFLNEL